MEMNDKNAQIVSELTNDDGFVVTIDDLECGYRARNIRTSRTSLGMTQTEFAALMRVSVTTLRDWEDVKIMPPEHAVAFAWIIAADPKYVEQTLATRLVS